MIKKARNEKTLPTAFLILHFVPCAFKVKFTIVNENYTSELSNSTSNEFKAIEDNLKMTMAMMYENDTEYVTTSINWFKASVGNYVMTNLSIMFNTDHTMNEFGQHKMSWLVSGDPSSPVLVFGTYNIDRNSITTIVEGDGEWSNWTNSGEFSKIFMMC